MKSTIFFEPLGLGLLATANKNISRRLCSWNSSAPQQESSTYRQNHLGALSLFLRHRSTNPVRSERRNFRTTRGTPLKKRAAKSARSLRVARDFEICTSTKGDFALGSEFLVVQWRVGKVSRTFCIFVSKRYAWWNLFLWRLQFRWKIIRCLQLMMEALSTGTAMELSVAGCGDESDKPTSYQAKPASWHGSHVTKLRLAKKMCLILCDDWWVVKEFLPLEFASSYRSEDEYVFSNRLRGPALDRVRNFSSTYSPTCCPVCANIHRGFVIKWQNRISQSWQSKIESSTSHSNSGRTRVSEQTMFELVNSD